MSDDEISTNNPMDVDFARNDSSSSPSVPTTTGIGLDLGIGSGYISGSDDERNDSDDDNQSSQDRKETITSKTSTPDSTTLSSSVTRKPIATTTKKSTTTKTKSALVNYDRDSDDDEHTEDEEDMEDDNEEPDAEDNNSNSNHGNIVSASGERDSGQNDENPWTEPTIGTSDLLNVTPIRTDDASPRSQTDITPNHQFIFPEDAEIRIPPLPSESCPTRLEKKFQDHYRQLKMTGVNQNTLIQERKDFRNPSLYEKIISHLGIDEIGTNFSQDLYDPHWWGKESYYEELSKAQKIAIERREQERRERTKIGFTPGVRKEQLTGLPTSSNESVVEKRKNRFDQ